MKSPHLRTLSWFILTLGFIVAPLPSPAALKDDIGYTALANELGAALPTGAGVSATHVEAFIDNINYLPDQTLGEFSQKGFILKSASSGISSHATSVALDFYGNSSIAPGLGNAASGAAVHLYSASGWIYKDFLRTNENLDPNMETQDVANFSWIGSGGSQVTNRLDLAITRDDFVAVVGLNNGSDSAIPELLAHSYNAISVGLTNGGHSTGQTTSDEAGRIKPEIVVPQGLVSFAVPVVGASAALLIEKARGTSSLASAARAQTVKALLLAGATKAEIPGWSRSSTSPLDSHYGAGELNVANSYHILVAGQQSASNNIVRKNTGWDFRMSADVSRRYFFTIPAGRKAATFSAVVTWHRTFSANDPPSVTNLNLRLSQASGTTVGSQLDTSVSAVDNVEHIYRTNLPAGNYVLEVSRVSGSNVDFGLAWESALIDLPTVTVTASTPAAGEGAAQPGVFTFTRTSTVELSQPLAVKYSLSGSAVNGTDYQTLSGTAVIPANAHSAIVSVVPLTDQLVEGPETVSLSLTAAVDYVVGSPSSASVTIADAPYQSWVFNNFPSGDRNNPAIVGETVDADSDGQVNLTEFVFGTGPLNAAEAFQPTVSFEDGELVYTYRQSLDSREVIVWPETSTDLRNWDSSSPQILSQSENTANGFVTTTLTLATPPEKQLFLRLQMER